MCGVETKVTNNRPTYNIFLKLKALKEKAPLKGIRKKQSA
jgi:hypothetical protein